MSCETAALIPPDSPLAQGWRLELSQLALDVGLAETFDALAALAEFMACREDGRRGRPPRAQAHANREIDPRDSMAPARRRINRKRAFPDFDPHRLLWS
jgi:hypothetical protein